MSIRPLADSIIRQMAAGEVIDSLAAAVRELIENALDAGASRISVEIWPPLWQVRVADNGAGILAADLDQVALRHTTSKVNDERYPLAVGTLGFRGEALHSLAQLGSLQIQTRAAADPHGWLASYDPDGRLGSCQPTAAALGTVVTLSDLFGAWPARRAALADPIATTKRVVAVLQDAALAHPQITWILKVEEEERLALWPSPSSLERLPQLLPQLRQEDLRLGTRAGLEVVVGLPDRCHRPRPNWVRLAVNGRVVQVSELTRAILAAFEQTLPRHRYPLCWAHLHLDPQDVDWNRHPAKTEIYLQDLEGHKQALQALIAATLRGSEPLPSRRSLQLIRLSEPKSAVYRPAQATPLQALAQLQNTYILAQHPEGLWLVEQHVAHERILYEALRRQWQPVELADPLLLEGLSPEQVSHLDHMGLEPEPFGQKVWRIRRLPSALLELDPAEQAATLEEISRCADLDAAQVAAACRAALRNGTVLSLAQMQALLDRWQATQNPHTCPHGRPIYLSLRESDLARFFHRRWSLCDRPRALGDQLAADILGSEPNPRVL